MTTRLAQDWGSTITIVAPSALTVDVPIAIGAGLFGVPVASYANGAMAALAIGGVYNLPKTGGGGVVFSLGEVVYWNEGTKLCTEAATDAPIGVCAVAADNAATSVGVLLNNGQVINASGAVLKTAYDANSILYATTDDTPVALTVATNSILGRQAGAIDDIAVAAQSILLRGAADIVDQAVGAGEFVGRPTGGNNGVINKANAHIILATTSEAETDALIGTGTIDGDRLKDDAFTTASFVSGAGGKFAPACLDTTALANVLADDAFTATEVSTAGAGGKFAAGAITTAGLSHLIAANAMTTATINDIVNNSAFTSAHFSGAEIKFAANAIDNAGLASVLADDAFTSTEVSTVGAGGKFAAGAITNGGVVHLFADDAFTASEFVAGAGGKFAPDCLDATALANVMATNAISEAVSTDVIATGAILATKIKSATLTELQLAVEANSGVRYMGVPFIVEYDVEGAAAAIDVEASFPYKVKVLKVEAYCSAANAGGTATLVKGTVGAPGNAITGATIMAVEGVTTAAILVHAEITIQATGTLHVNKNGAGDDGWVRLTCIRIA